MSLLAEVSRAISNATGMPFEATASDAIEGGCINRAFSLSAGRRRYFVKTHDAGKLSMFEAEAAGLEALASAHGVRVPRPLCNGVAAGRAFLVLEYLELLGRGDAARLGAQLARQHRVTQDRFGWTRDNTLGSTPQPNAWADDWLQFWREQRLGFQLELAARNGMGSLQREGDALLARFGALFAGYRPRPSLLHGDLWGGNHGFLADGAPVIFDPAVYFGDRECDLAMTELFGGFAPDFYAAYREAWPLDAGYATRRTLYNLYHILNHANLFGGGYAAQAHRMTAQLLAELR
ncbi:MAG: hypothetical protein QG662_2035 [Pseudomonadota bacterium]|nr:hypothetical protein [Pseudomonadota bacterium]